MELTLLGRSEDADCLGFEDSVEVVEEVEDDRWLDVPVLTVGALQSNKEEEEVGGAFFEWEEEEVDDKVVF